MNSACSTSGRSVSKQTRRHASTANTFSVEHKFKSGAESTLAPADGLPGRVRVPTAAGDGHL
jgi:hypothetical protein